MIYINDITCYKDLIELIKSNELIRDNAQKSLDAINNYLNSIDKPKGYKTKTSYTDYDAICGARVELGTEMFKKLTDEARQLENIILLQDANLERYYKMRDEYDNIVNNTTDAFVKVKTLRELGMTQEEVAEAVEKSTRTIQRMEKKNREEN